jgi:hypothetical protein
MDADVGNSIFIGNDYGINYASQNGGTVANCTFADNITAGMFTGGLSSVDVVNSLLWENAQGISGAPNSINYTLNQDGTGGGSNNTNADPGFVGYGTNDAWSANATYDASTGITTLTDTGMGWTPDELAGIFINPDSLNQNRYFYILGNTADEVYVWGDASIAAAGESYVIESYFIDDTSAASDSGLNTSAPQDASDADNDADTTETVPWDAYGMQRIMGGTVDMGAVESVSTTVGAGGTIYVNCNVDGGTGSGADWTNAFRDLDAALMAAAGNAHEIWVAQGTYLPSSVGDRTVAFDLSAGIELYGGFDGTEVARSARDWEQNTTILTGDLNGDDGPAGANRSDNSYNVVRIDGDDNTVVDGFRIIGGNANHATVSAMKQGGGMFLSSASNVRIANCEFTDNYAVDAGGGLMLLTAPDTTVISDCTFSDNSAGSSGGGLAVSGGGPQVFFTGFFGNSAHDGGGAWVYNSTGAADFINCIFSGNRATDSGGGAVRQSLHAGH